MSNPTPQRPYFRIEMQRTAILERLAKTPATFRQLLDELNIPDPRARIHELRKDGFNIDSHKVDQVNPDGTVNRVYLYALYGKTVLQKDLFESAPA